MPGFRFLGDIFKLTGGNTFLLPQYEPGEPPSSLAAQYGWFSYRHPLVIILIQVGRFCELYKESAQKAAETLRIRISKNCRGFRFQAGLPMGGLHTAKKRLKAVGCAYIVVAENGWLPNGLKNRVMTEKYFIEQPMVA